MNKILILTFFLLSSITQAQITTHTGGGGDGGDPKDCIESEIKLFEIRAKLCPSCRTDAEFNRFVDDQYSIYLLKIVSEINVAEHLKSNACCTESNWTSLHNLYLENLSSVYCKYKVDSEHIEKVGVLAGKASDKKIKKLIKKK